MTRRRINGRLTSLGPGESSLLDHVDEEAGFDIGGVHVPAIDHGRAQTDEISGRVCRGSAGQTGTCTAQAKS
jgi:hypothetical protein